MREKEIKKYDTRNQISVSYRPVELCGDMGKTHWASANVINVITFICLSIYVLLAHGAMLYS